MTLGARYCRAG